MINFRLLILAVLLIFVTEHTVFEAAFSYGQDNINIATYEELMMIPFLGSNMRLVQNILAFRDENGPVTSLTDLLFIAGMSKKTLKEIKPYLKTEGKTDIYRLEV